MLEIIKVAVTEARDKILAQETAEIARQKAVANQNVIIPKLAEYEKEKQAKIAEINAEYDKKAKDFTELTNLAVENKVKDSFKKELAKLTEMLADKE